MAVRKKLFSNRTLLASLFVDCKEFSAKCQTKNDPMLKTVVEQTIVSCAQTAFQLAFVIAP
jgi:hypothetical protein